MKIERVHSKQVRDAALASLTERGVSIEAIAEIVHAMQSPYYPTLAMEACIESVQAVLEKREIQHAILVGIELDKLAEKGLLSEPLQSIIAGDEGLFGCDETLALGSVFGYGSIAVTTFGHLDKQKIGIIKQLDNKTEGKVNTFLDDMVCSIAANASSRMAHRLRDEEETEAARKKEESDELRISIGMAGQSATTASDQAG
ncbi:phosphatidylglycerophosphatase A family protein [Brevibacillus laterosporus]|uniref:phosphatidylglycerophosphatase A family protein n=1 Tax=Brevibacillus laterosporus TaxID=1465 RepID=UPI000374837B|nr:phosphatidylglycerophosphatase A [Brevibacillus laterosporus]ATO48431.1 phosphatidylglycerophosphatase A [Brevibacillus laterosporus DSM 25]AYB41413.1 phosphatidylglycerophosphatase A [Brevibacillus laterosporus]MBG9771780.1 phosphatidylglycerophosphatase [Brevibacillus laterosporus]MBG9796472.1 phosphatidylglycerophosphatase [Brevibacillus laterosporus]MBG9802303.1 phosphatidylglycerophosphatase [Brevibacillus laterosporus]